MGFAVVADEVRNLAGRAANAARESAETLESVGDLVERSRELAGTTSQEFNIVHSDAQKIGGLMAEIATACREQSSALADINNSLSQFEQGTQAGAAHAEEAAAAAQELRGQALSIRAEIDVLDQLVTGHRTIEAVAATPVPGSRPPPPARPSAHLVQPAVSRTLDTVHS
jgi:methyl-accepting chemotaxis protein